MKILKRLKVLLWLPFMILYVPMLIILGNKNTDDIGCWIQQID